MRRLVVLLLFLFPACEWINTSTDGRYHSCGVVTEQGVTEHLDAYSERCGDNR